MQDKKKIIIINIWLSILMVSFTSLLIYTFSYDKSLVDRTYSYNYVETFDIQYINWTLIVVLYSVSISGIISVFILNIIVAYIYKNKYDNKVIWKTQISGGMLFVTTLLLIGNNLKGKAGK